MPVGCRLDDESLSWQTVSAQWRYGPDLTTCWSPASGGLRGRHTSPPSSLGTSAGHARCWLLRRCVPRGWQSGGAVAPAQTPASPCADVSGTRGYGTAIVTF